jgi:hypothetical protein
VPEARTRRMPGSTAAPAARRNFGEYRKLEDSCYTSQEEFRRLNALPAVSRPKAARVIRVAADDGWEVSTAYCKSARMGEKLMRRREPWCLLMAARASARPWPPPRSRRRDGVAAIISCLTPIP